MEDVHHSPIMRFLQSSTLASLCFGAVALSALAARADDSKAQPEGTAVTAREEAGEGLPPLPRSVKYKVTTEFEGLPSQTSEVVRLGADRKRTTTRGGAVSISNRGTTISLDPDEKTAIISQNPEKDDEGLGIFGYYRKLLTDPRYNPEVRRETLGESAIDGRPVIGHRIAKPGEITRIWVERQSLLPVQIEVTTRMYSNSKTIQTDFVFDVDLDDSIFSVEPPDGYTVFREPVKKEAYEEKDLIAILRQWREQGHSTFPYALDGGDYREMVLRSFPGLGGNPTPEQFEQLREWVAQTSGGFFFVDRLPPEADAHYAGEDVKVDATDTPIFWYKPQGKGKYRVICADLSVIETDTPPEIPDAQSISDWGREQLVSRTPYRKPSDPSPFWNTLSYIKKIRNHREPQRRYRLTAKRDLEFIDELSDTFSNTQGERTEVLTIGSVETSDGLFPIRMFVLNKDAESAKVLLIGAVHGTEPAGAYTLASMLRRREELVDRFPGVCFHIVPVANPWGFVHDHRYNEQGINIGSDFTLLASSEAAIIHGEIEKHTYDLAISLHEAHSTANWICVYTLKDVEMFTPLVKSLESSGHELSKSPTREFFRGIANEKGISYCPRSVSGLLLLAERENLPFFLMRKGVPAFVIETGKGNELDQRIDFAQKAVYAVVEEYTSEQQ